jgi:hypothetical protein
MMLRRVCVVLALTAWPALADDYLPYKMVANQQSPFTFYVDSRSNRPAGIDYTIMQNAYERALATWNGVNCSYVKTRSLGPSVGVVSNPISTIDSFSVAPIWMLNQDPDAQQLFGNSTYVIAITLPRAYAGVLQTCDTYLNGFNASWSADAVTPTGTNDLETVVLHEMGHCLGLGHYGGDNEVMEQVVQEGSQVRALSSIDVQVLCARYPLGGVLGGPCLGDGGCTSALKCLQQPTTNGVTLRLCTEGCNTGANATCDIPLSCQSSNAFSATGFNGACLMPGSIITQVGKPCVDAQQDCGNSFAQCRRPEMASGTNFFWVDGYCTQRCETGDPVCPAGSTCVTLDTGRMCGQSCRVGLADCRPSYACAPIDAIGTSGVCIPRCYNDADCADPVGTTCRTCDGLCVNRQNISGQIGDLCQNDSNCGAGQTCRPTDPRSSVKQCTQQCARGCAECPNGSTCTPGAGGELFCLRDCTGPGTCPVGLRCADTTVGKSCQPQCSIDTDCPVGQFCYLNECYTPQEDAGCGTLCTRPDAGKPIVVPRKDGGVGDGGSGGCGCSSVDPLVLAALGALIVGRRRSRRPS